MYFVIVGKVLSVRIFIHIFTKCFFSEINGTVDSLQYGDVRGNPG